MKADNNIVRLFIAAAAKHSNAVAFIEKDEQLTYAALLQKVQAAAAYFAKKGFEKGDKVLVLIPMTTKLYIVVLSLLYIGAVPVFLDEWVSLKRLKVCLQTVPCKGIIASPKLLFVSWFISSLRYLKKITPGSIFTNDLLPHPIAVFPNDTALVTFTTGSTGTPKAANRTHQFLQAQYSALYPLLDNTYNTTLTLLPIVVLLNLRLGKTNILPAGKLQAGKESAVLQLAQLIERHHIKSLIASPAITVAVAKAAASNSFQTGSVQQVITGGGPVFPEQAKVVGQAFKYASATVVYGSTEAEPISTISMQNLSANNAVVLQQKGLPVGSVHEDIKLAIVPFTQQPIPNLQIDEFCERKLPVNCSGELIVTGPHVLQQYLNNEVAQRQNKFYVAGRLWHRTGDEARIDEAGDLYFLGRCNEVIDWMGQKLHPLIAMWLLKQHVAVQEAALLLLNNRLLVVLEKKDAHLAQSVKAYTEKALPDSIIRWVKTIPKDKRHQTKIDYEKLRKFL